MSNRFYWESDGGDTHNRSYPTYYYVIDSQEGERLDCATKKIAKDIVTLLNETQISKSDAEIMINSQWG